MRQGIAGEQVAELIVDSRLGKRLQRQKNQTATYGKHEYRQTSPKAMSRQPVEPAFIQTAEPARGQKKCQQGDGCLKVKKERPRKSQVEKADVG